MMMMMLMVVTVTVMMIAVAVLHRLLAPWSSQQQQPQLCNTEGEPP